MTETGFSAVHFTASDGTPLYAADYERGGLALPLLCLPGLTRNHKDFIEVAERYAPSRRVIAPDFRGRGRSGYADPQTYRVEVELADVISLLDQLDISRVAVLGTSRGGIVGMAMAAFHLPRIAGLCLVDIGPELAPEGLARIARAVNELTSFGTWSAAAVAIAMAAPGFEGVSEDQWLRAARRMFIARNGRIERDCDSLLGAALPPPGQSGPKLGDLWAFVPALKGLPLALIRGTGSDLLAYETALRFKADIPDLDWTEVPGRGHVPFLDEEQSTAAIDRFLARVDWAEATFRSPAGL